MAGLFNALPTLLEAQFRTRMAETIRLRVKCHACSNLIEGTAKYGSGHYVAEGIPFEFVAVGKVEGAQGRRVKAEVTCTCPNCGVKCKYIV